MKVKGKGQNIELNKRNETIEDNPKMKTFDDMLAKQLQNDEFKKEYEAIQPEMNEIRASADSRTSQEKINMAVGQF